MWLQVLYRNIKLNCLYLIVTTYIMYTVYSNRIFLFKIARQSSGMHVSRILMAKNITPAAKGQKATHAY